jgi:N-acetylglucosaminyldiphosphoundecaprenol N-acetyl-beta-D-mannosaminyltransferase
LLVALGAPKQELWIDRHLADTGCQLGIGVGGLFDFYSGRLPRAPKWMREAGLEWLYRFWQEPGRLWKRYFIGNAVFLFRVGRRRWRRESTPQE